MVSNILNQTKDNGRVHARVLTKISLWNFLVYSCFVNQSSIRTIKYCTVSSKIVIEKNFKSKIKQQIIKYIFVILMTNKKQNNNKGELLILTACQPTYGYFKSRG